MLGSVLSSLHMLTHSLSTLAFGGSVVIIPTLQMRKLRPKMLGNMLCLQS